MINKLRIKFIKVAMFSLIAVFSVLLIAINVTNYLKVNSHTDDIMRVLIDNNGQFPKDSKKPDNIFENKRHDLDYLTKNPKAYKLNIEVPFSTRYFSAIINSNGAFTTISLSNVASVNREQALEYVTQASKKSSASGYVGIYKYAIKELDNGGKMYIFLDCDRELDTFQSFLVISIVVSLVGIAGVFILVLIFSKSAIKPIVESYEKQKQFITDASHEIKTPLTIIDANTEVVEIEYGENEWTKSTKNQIKRLTHLTNSLVSLARMDEESSELSMCEFNLSDLAVESAELFDSLFKTGNKSLSLNIEDNIIINGNDKSISQLISILLDNALKYSPDGSEVRFKLEKQKSVAKLCVYNEAENLPKGDLSILFERFYRVDKSRNSKTGGYGIGLSIAKAIVEKHRGKISAFSEDGKSILITVEI